MHGLNASSHLPISAKLSLSTKQLNTDSETNMHSHINWEQAINSGKLHSYQELVSSTLTNLIGKSYNSIEDLNKELVMVTESIKEAALLKCKQKE